MRSELQRFRMGPVSTVSRHQRFCAVSGYSLPLRYESMFWDAGCVPVAGCDEAGRGCLAGPVVAAAVVLPRGVMLDGVTDSKVLGRDAREEAFGRITCRAVDVGIGRCSAREIDEMNVLRASLVAMQRALDGLDCDPGAVLVDGNQLVVTARSPQVALVKGDSRSHTIAAASVVAKVMRDRLMYALHEDYPMYGWDTNVGYPTKQHYAALREHGPSPHHRRSFRLE